MNWPTLLPPALMALSSIAALVMMAIYLRKARLIEDTPSSRIRSAPQGYVELSGFAHANGNNNGQSESAGNKADLLMAPLTKIPCVWYRYRIERYERGDKNSRWRTIESGASEQWFVLDDDSGRCHVDPRGAEVTPTTRQRWQGESRQPVATGRNPATPSFSIFGIEPFSLSLDLWSWGAQEYRYTEWRIHAGEWLYALGQFETVHAPTGEERTQTQMKNLLNQWKQNRDELLARFDRNGDGEIDLQEWELARREAERVARAEIVSAPASAPVSVLTRPPSRQQPYLIATTDPEQLARRYRWYALFSPVIGFGLAAIIGKLHWVH